jgi:hypothetical protein
MTRTCIRRVLVCLALTAVFSNRAAAQIDARMFRYPAVSRDQIAFVYAGDIWLAPKTGGDRRAAHLIAGRRVVSPLLA